MLSNKPYLVRAFYDWIVDSKCTPLLVIDATLPRCNVPKEYVENGEIVLNISPEAVRDFKINSNLVEFKASFSGIAYLISAPVRAVLAIYAEENGQGMFFDMEDEEGGSTSIETGWDDGEVPNTPAQNTDPNKPTSPDKRKSHLKLVE